MWEWGWTHRAFRAFWLNELVGISVQRVGRRLHEGDVFRVGLKILSQFFGKRNSKLSHNFWFINWMLHLNSNSKLNFMTPVSTWILSPRLLERGENPSWPQRIGRGLQELFIALFCGKSRQSRSSWKAFAVQNLVLIKIILCKIDWSVISMSCSKQLFLSV